MNHKDQLLCELNTDKNKLEIRLKEIEREKLSVEKQLQNSAVTLKVMDVWDNRTENKVKIRALMIFSSEKLKTWMNQTGMTLQINLHFY